MIRNVFLDLDDTIFDFHKAERIALTRTLRSFGIEPSDAAIERYSEINKERWQLLEAGVLTRPQVLLSRFEIFFAELGVTADATAVKAQYESFLSEGHYFMPGAPELLDALKGKYRLYLASNGTSHVQKGRLDSSGIRPYFDGIFVSEAVGADKPSAAFFERCFATIPDFSAAETVMIGDSITSDMTGAIGVGIHTIWYNPKAKACPGDLSIEKVAASLDEIPAMLLEF